MTVTATLNGVPLLASKPVRWPLRAGVDPVVETFEMEPRFIRRLEGGSNAPLSATLKIGDFTWRRLSIIDFVPGPNPHIGAVTVADRRWLWPYKWVLKRFNLRRLGGFKRRTDWQADLQLDPIRVVQFAKFSLKDEQTEWEPEDALMDILTSEEALDIPKSAIVKDGFVNATLKELRLDNIRIDDPGHMAVAQIIRMIPGADLYIDPQGRVVLFSRVSGGENRVMRENPQEIMQGGHVALNTNELSRPSKVAVYFTIESEVRFNHTENFTGTVVSGEKRAIRDMDNVLAVPDFKLDFENEPDANGDLVDGSWAQGTWVEFAAYFRAIVNAAEGRGLLQNMTISDWHRVIREAFIPETNLWSSLFLAGQADTGVGGADTDWAARLGSFQSHFRTTYRLNAKWMDRTLSIRPYTVATLDITTGQRSPALVWANYAVRSGFGLRIKQAKLLDNGTNIAYALNVHGYDNFQIDDNARPSPARVQILDHDQGVIHINYLLDPYSQFDLVFPSHLIGFERMANPSNSNKFAQIPPTWDCAAANGKVPSLSQFHKFSVVLTLVPASPNNKKQLYKIEVTPDKIKNRLPAAAQRGVTNAQGPVKEVRVSPGLVTALVRWKDDRFMDIERIFGIREDEDPDFSQLVVNDVDPAGQHLRPDGIAASISEVAFSIAAAIYAGEADRLTGQRTVPMNGQITPAGNLLEVNHEVLQNGVTISTMVLPSKVKPLPFVSFMDQGTRAILFREAQSAKGAGG